MLKFKSLIVAKREFLATVKTKGFIFSLILPFLIILVVVLSMGSIPQIISQTPQNIGFVDETGMMGETRNLIRFSDIEGAKNALLENEISSFFVVSKDYIETGKISIYSRDGLLGSPPTDSIDAFLIENLIRESDLDETFKDRIKDPANEEIITLNEKGDVEEKSGVGFIIPYALGILLMMVLMTSSGYLMQGIVAEKENRTIEILLSSISANQLLTGKILGFGSAGTLQVLIWTCSGALMVFLTPYSSLFQGIELSWILIVAIPYFILGYLLFAASMACVAAPAGTMRDAQQGASIFTMFAVLPMILLSFITRAPNSIIAKALSYIPYTSPVTMLVRIAIVEVPGYELLASLLILSISVIVMVRLSAKIFRAGILMHGTKIKLKDVFKYLRE